MTSFRVPFVFACMLLIAVPAAADTLSFQQGDGGAYSTTDATTISNTAFNYGSEIRLAVVTHYTQSLIRFPDLIGSNPGQIASGSTIASASLTMTMNGAYNEVARSDIHRVYVAWDENTVTGYGFWAQPGTLYGPKVGEMPAGDPYVHVSADVTSLVQDWAGGDPNFGLMMRVLPPYYDPGGFNITLYYSDDAPELAWRPMLTVEFTPPSVAVESTTWGRVKALYR